MSSQVITDEEIVRRKTEILREAKSKRTYVCYGCLHHVVKRGLPHENCFHKYIFCSKYCPSCILMGKLHRQKNSQDCSHCTDTAKWDVEMILDIDMGRYYEDNYVETPEPKESEIDPRLLEGYEIYESLKA